nr:hypothetical protein [Tanacetum cinerariifolium]
MERIDIGCTRIQRDGRGQRCGDLFTCCPGSNGGLGVSAEATVTAGGDGHRERNQLAGLGVEDVIFRSGLAKGHVSLDHFRIGFGQRRLDCAGIRSVSVIDLVAACSFGSFSCPKVAYERPRYAHLPGRRPRQPGPPLSLSRRLGPRTRSGTDRYRAVSHRAGRRMPGRDARPATPDPDRRGYPGAAPWQSASAAEHRPTLRRRPIRRAEGSLALLSDRRLGRAWQAMLEDPAHDWSIEALAEQASMSRATFMRA